MPFFGVFLAEKCQKMGGKVAEKSLFFGGKPPAVPIHSHEFSRAKLYLNAQEQDTGGVGGQMKRSPDPLSEQGENS